MRAVQWTNDGEGWSGAPLDTPRRTDSTAIFVDGFTSSDPLPPGVATVGTVCFDGLCDATMWGPGGAPINLHTNPDFTDSIAYGLFGDGGALAVVGRMTDAEGDVGAVCGEGLFL